MEKVLILKGKKEYIEDLGREVRVIKESSYFVSDTSKDFHTKYGHIKKSDLKKKSGKVKSDMGKDFSIFDPSFIDHYRRIKRLAQIIPLKDIGAILAFTGIGKESVIVDAGTGSGALSLFMARYAKKVTSYDIVEEHHELGKVNSRTLGIKNITFKLKDVYKKIDEKNVDLITLDVPEPWKVSDNAAKSLKRGGFLVSYSPCIPQTQDMVNEMLGHDDFIHIKTVEMIERPWEIDGRKVRPRSKASIHSGFLSLFRRI